MRPLLGERVSIAAINGPASVVDRGRPRKRILELAELLGGAEPADPSADHPAGDSFAVDGRDAGRTSRRRDRAAVCGSAAAGGRRRSPAGRDRGRARQPGVLGGQLQAASPVPRRCPQPGIGWCQPICGAGSDGALSAMAQSCLRGVAENVTVVPVLRQDAARSPGRYWPPRQMYADGCGLDGRACSTAGSVGGAAAALCVLPEAVLDRRRHGGDPGIWRDGRRRAGSDATSDRRRGHAAGRFGQHHADRPTVCRTPTLAGRSWGRRGRGFFPVRGSSISLSGPGTRWAAVGLRN